jgi:hypothetical protein
MVQAVRKKKNKKKKNEKKQCLSLFISLNYENFNLLA